MRREDNELICSVGPGTPMGEVFRRYWTPIAVARQVAEVDGAPVRARFAGEAYVLFRDTDGRLGLLDELCPHRGASLVLGRNEECGIRCLYHGWKYDVDGNLLDAPNYGNESFRAKLKAVSYPVREAGGLIWGYFGPAELQPPLPDYGFMDVDEPYRNMFGAAAFDGVNQAGGKSNPLWDIYPLPPPAPGSLVFLAVHDITRNMGPTEVLMGAWSSCRLPERG